MMSGDEIITLSATSRQWAALLALAEMGAALLSMPFEPAGPGDGARLAWERARAQLENVPHVDGRGYTWWFESGGQMTVYSPAASTYTMQDVERQKAWLRQAEVEAGLW